MTRAKIFDLIVAERKRQDTKWGTPNAHYDFVWNAILNEEVGEVAHALLKPNCDLKNEIVQVAAVAVAWLEDLENDD